MVDPRTLSPIELAAILREHLDDEWVPFLNELERAWIQMWAREMLGKINNEEGTCRLHP